ncbi:nucleotidyltransferase domain-containing protein [Patescibacteria group bacterium]|nr:nucleotidyltransferase domain-containing protein [Patescibacteria group bacterium]
MLKKKYLDIINKILWVHLDKSRDRAFIFGSWAIGDNRKWSDIDIGIESKRKITFEILSRLNEDFDESNLPYAVDVVDFSGTTKQFQAVAKQAVIPLN